MGEELINIANYCNSLLVKHGQVVTHCNAVYIKEDDVIELRLRYKFNKNDSYNTFQYVIQSFNFLITDTEVLVNRDTVEIINHQIERRLNPIQVQHDNI